MPQKKRATTEYLEKRSRVRNGDSRIQVQLQEDGGGSSRQNWMKKSGLWLHRELQGIRHVVYWTNLQTVSKSSE